MKRLLYAVYAVVAGLLLAELGLRTVLESRVPPRASDERSVAYRHDPLLGWFPRENSEVTYTASRTVVVRHNERGFRDRPHRDLGDEVRIVALGDSFVWGYDVEAEERFTDLLDRRLPGVRVLNFGVSGYGTDQSYLLLRQQIDVYRPQLVFYVFSATDVLDCATRFAYGAYYKPYFLPNGGQLDLQGVPVPKSVTYFFRDRWPWLGKSHVVRATKDLFDRLRHPRIVLDQDLSPSLVFYLSQLAGSRGALLVVLMADANPSMTELMERVGIPSVDLAGIDPRYRYRDDARHWNADGHRLVAGILQRYLLESGLLVGTTGGDGAAVPPGAG